MSTRSDAEAPAPISGETGAVSAIADHSSGESVPSTPGGVARPPDIHPTVEAAGAAGAVYARRIPPGWAVLERAMAERRWHIEVWANPNAGGFTARTTDARHAFLRPNNGAWWGHGPTAVDALQDLARHALADTGKDDEG